MTSTLPGWQRLGSHAPTALVAARLQLHWAAQLASAVGTSLLPAAADDSHTNLEWLADPGALAGNPVGSDPRYRAAVRPADLALLLLDERNMVVAAHPLHGWTFGEGMNWLAQEIAAFTRRPLPQPLRRRALDLPDHAVGRGAPFSAPDTDAFAELGRWYANADALLRAFATPLPAASPVRCWPHHFDIATLITVAAAADASGPRTVGVGLSPGDGSYAEPYWYVTPWPYPKAHRLGALDGGGMWHQGDWLGAVLVGSRLVAGATAAAQHAQADAFIRSAVTACQALVAGAS